MDECATCGYPRWRTEHDAKIHYVVDHWDEVVDEPERYAITQEDIDFWRAVWGIYATETDILTPERMSARSVLDHLFNRVLPSLEVS